jgi:uncharacterized protein
MKSLYATFAFVILLPFVAFAYTSPGKPQGFVSDFANIIDSSTEASLQNKLQALRDANTVEIAVVTISTLGDESIETFAVKLFEEWGIGKKGSDNGILLLVAPNEKEVRIEVGYGMEPIITDLLANNIVQKTIIPEFKKGDYSAGIAGGVDALVGIINNTVDPSEFAGTNQSKFGALDNINPEFIFFLVFIFISVFSRILSKSKSWWAGGLIGAGIGVVVSLFLDFVAVRVIVIVMLTVLGLIFDFVVSKNGPGKGGPGGFWFGSGGMGGGHSGGGGFGGFGGGFSGGGGASGRW